LKPSFSEFKTMAKQGNLIPVCQEFLADTETPVSAYLKISDKAFSYLLESADSGSRWGRYSFIGYKPGIVLLARNGDVEIKDGSGENVIREAGNPLSVLKELSQRFKPVTSTQLPPFQGGLVGYVNYDLVRKWERVTGIFPEDPDLPECVFTAAERMIVFDHLTHKIKVAAFAHINGHRNLEEAYEYACRGVAETIDELWRPLADYTTGSGFSIFGLKPDSAEEEFKEAVRKAKEYIVSGEAIQVVLSQRFSGKASGDDFGLYRNLRSVNPSPYMFYLNLGEVRLIGSSPEILVRLTDGKVELRPIAGTRPRGRTPEEDMALASELIEDPKERAEHIMLVDLGRNDVGKVSLPGTVEVPRFMEVERYSHVMHIVSRVEGRLKPDMDSFDLFMSAFPAGTVTGAPKVRAMEIINELEPFPRGPYAGAVGYFGFNGNMDFCITIRTISVIKGKLSIQVGAGIVADSTPEGEYEETLRKAAAMMEAVKKVGKNDSVYR